MPKHICEGMKTDNFQSCFYSVPLESKCSITKYYHYALDTALNVLPPPVYLSLVRSTASSLNLSTKLYNTMSWRNFCQWSRGFFGLSQIVESSFEIPPILFPLPPRNNGGFLKNITPNQV